MGRENKYFKVGGFRFLQALTPRERYSRFIVARPSEPLSRHRERGWGERADALRLPWERFCAQYGLIFGSRRKSIRIQHSQRQGSWGRAPSVFCFGAPDGSQDPVGKGGAAERWRVAPCASGATRHGAQPAMTHTSKRNATAASRTGGHLSVTSPRRRRLQTTPAGQACLLIPCKRLAPPQAPTNCFTNTKPS